MLSFCGVSTAISALIVQTFLIRRLYQLTRQFWLHVFLILAAVVACLAGAITAIWCGLISSAYQLGVVIPLAIVWYSIVAGVDIIITVTLSRALWRSKTGYPATNTIIHQCIRASIQSDLFSSVFAVANLVGFVLWNNTHINLIFAWPLGMIYSNSLLYTLVARKELAEIANQTVEIRDSGPFPFPLSPRISSVRVQREDVTDSRAAGHDDQSIIFSQLKADAP